jgi:hypothetical protein
MRLPRGVTAFGRSNIPPSLTDFRYFKAVCYEAARRLNGQIAPALSREAGVTPNFHSVSFILPNVAIDVICNRALPLVAVVESFKPGQVAPVFVDVPGLAKILEETGTFHVLQVTELIARLTPNDLSDLDAGEIQQVKYWEPERIGDLVSHFWD